ncbi:MAG: hypothetical protein H0T18_05530, partial [Chloroflexia bacterium]|nr:hypothetical protein [Chloroflexia bacterium]
MTAAIQNAVSRLEPAALELLRSLIRTASVTGDEGDHLTERTVAGQLWRSLGSQSGVSRHAQPVYAGRDNVVAVVGNTP